MDVVIFDLVGRCCDWMSTAALERRCFAMQMKALFQYGGGCDGPAAG